MALFGQIRPQDLVSQQFFAPQADTRSPLVAALTGAITQGRADAGQRRQQQAFGAGAQALFQGTETPEQIADLFTRDPARAKSLLEGAGAFTAKGQEKLANTAFRIQSIQNPQQRNQALQQVVQQMQSGGGDPSAFANLIGQSPEQQNSGLQALQSAALSVKQRADLAEGQQRIGLSERQVSASERNVASQIASRQANQALNQQKFQQAQVVAQNAINAGVQIDAKGRRSINSDITGLIKESVAIHASAKSLEGLEKLGSAASRLAAVFKFMKALDPTSVVRETEQGQVYAASGAASQLAGQLNSILGKGKLTDAGFKDLVATSKNIANSSLNSTSGSVKSYLDTFEDTLPNSFKLRLTNRVPDLFVLPRSQQAAPDGTGAAQVSPAPAAAPTNIGRFSVRVLN